MTNNDIPTKTSSLNNVQPTSHTSEHRVFPSLPNTTENLNFINKFSFQFSDLTDTEYNTLCNLLLKHKTCYATHQNDVGKIATPFRIRVKPNAQLLTQRPSKVLIHYIDKLNALLKELEKYNIIKQIVSSPQDKPVYGTSYLNLRVTIPKGNSIKCVLDARHLNSNTEQFDEPWPIEPLAPQLARANKKYKCAIDLMHMQPLMKKPSNLQASHLVINSWASYEAFMVSKDFKSFPQNNCQLSSKLLLNKVLLLYILMTFYFCKTLKNTCFNL